VPGNDNTERMLGQVDGKLDSLLGIAVAMAVDHNARHEKIDEDLKAHAADINKAKGAKAAVFAAAAAISTFVGAAVAAANHLLK
jgi:malate/lactate dehydrogenase